MQRITAWAAFATVPLVPCCSHRVLTLPAPELEQQNTNTPHEHTHTRPHTPTHTLHACMPCVVFSHVAVAMPLISALIIGALACLSCQSSLSQPTGCVTTVAQDYIFMEVINYFLLTVKCLPLSRNNYLSHGVPQFKNCVVFLKGHGLVVCARWQFVRAPENSTVSSLMHSAP